MREAEVAQVLALAATYDARLTPPTDADARVRAASWHLALAHDLPVDFAREVVINHYAQTDRTLTASVLNTAWRAERGRAEQRRAQMDRRERRGVPMPDEVRERIRALREQTG